MNGIDSLISLSDKELMVHIHNGILLAIKMNTFESLPMRCRNLGHIIQSEVHQKEKDKYHFQMHKYKM